MLILVMMMVVHLGTMLDIQELIDQWKTVVVTLAGMLGILVVILTVGTVILGKETAAVAAPPLTGGFVAAMMLLRLNIWQSWLWLYTYCRASLDIRSPASA